MSQNLRSKPSIFRSFDALEQTASLRRDQRQPLQRPVDLLASDRIPFRLWLRLQLDNLQLYNCWKTNLRATLTCAPVFVDKVLTKASNKSRLRHAHAHSGTAGWRHRHSTYSESSLSINKFFENIGWFWDNLLHFNDNFILKLNVDTTKSKYIFNSHWTLNNKWFYNIIFLQHILHK